MLEKTVTNLRLMLSKYCDSLKKFKSKRCKDLVTYIDSKVLGDNIEIVGAVDSEVGNDYYDTSIIIDTKENDIVYTSCECADFYGNDSGYDVYVCKHIGGTFLKYIENVETGKSEYSGNKKKKDFASIIIDNINKNMDEPKELINLEVFITNSANRRSLLDVSLKVGQKKLYVVKNIQDFIGCKEDNKTMEFGKGFVYDPSMHYFSKEDESILKFIAEYTEVSSVINETAVYSYGYRRYTAPSKLIKGKNLTLVESALIRFLRGVGNKAINIEVQNFNGKVRVVEEDLPIKLNIKQDEDKNIIVENNDNLPIRLTSAGDVAVYNDNIYITSKEQANLYSPFYEALKEEKKIVFKKEKADEVFTKVIPIINTIATEVELDKELEKKVENSNVLIDFYFDKNKDDIWCKVKLTYGEERFDLLGGSKSDKYIIRDLKSENKVIRALENHNFYINKDKFQFNGDDDELFIFLSNGIESFRDFGEVYYSEKFKEQRVYKSKSISASVGERGDYLEFTFSIGDIDAKDINNILKAFKDKRKFYKLKNNSFVDLNDDKVIDFLTLLDNVSDEKKIKGNTIELHKNRAIYLSDTIKDKKLEFVKGSEVVDSIAEHVATSSNINYDLPDNLNATLREYQVSGYKWFKTLSHYGFGGILADEMGLGKTLQTITFLLSEEGKKSLIVTPTSLIYNWKKEFEKFAPTLNVLILHGGKEQRLAQMKEINNYDVVLTTYGTLRNDFEAYNKMKFDYCIIDEGQNIKNPLAQSSEAVKDIKANVKFALTGTPMENNLMELWSIFDFIMPSYLYNMTKFQQKFIKKSDEDAMNELKKLIRPFMLRRLKAEVMTELPDKIEKKFFVEMTKEQKKVYGTYVKDIQEKMESEDFTDDKITVFSYLTKLRQLCLDPSILVEGYTGGSGKLKVALDMISDNIEAGNKILLFSQFTSVLANICSELDKNNIGYYYLDGSTKASDRLDLVDSFNNDNEKKIFLISLKAGGTGLNLTSANVVIHFDPWWNPAIEDQATDRAHRFGQKNVVEVIKLISQGTVEEKIILMQESKKELISQVMSGEFKEGSFLKSLSSEEIVELFK